MFLHPAKNTSSARRLKFDNGYSNFQYRSCDRVLSFCRLYFIYFLRELYTEKVLQELFGCIFLGAHRV